MEIEGWHVRADQEGNFLRTSRERPKTHYLITLVNRYAIDIELLKSEVDALSSEVKEQTLMDVLRNAIKEAGDKGPSWAGDMQWN
jgi:hypothetical protein